MAVVADALMQRAAHGLRGHGPPSCVRTRGRVYGAPGAGAGRSGQQRRRRPVRRGRGSPAAGSRVTAVPASGTPHAAGLAALRAAGGRLIDLADRARPSPVMTGRLPTSSWTAFSGSAAGRVCRTTRRAGRRLQRSGGAVDRGRPAVRSRRRHRRRTRRRRSARRRTVTFGEAKPCHLIEPARSRCGRSSSSTSGSDATGTGTPVAGRLGRPTTCAAALALSRTRRSDKYSRGVVGIDTGSEAYPGRRGDVDVFGAVHGGAGMVRFLGPERAGGDHRDRLPNVVFCAGPGAGPPARVGLGRPGRRRRGARRLLDSGLPAVVDADGLRYLPDRLPGTLAAHPARRRAGPAAGRERGVGRATTRSAPSAPGSRGPVRPCCSRARPSSSAARAAAGRGRAARPGLDGPGRIRRRARRAVRRVLAAGCRPHRRRRCLVQALAAARIRPRRRASRGSGAAGSAGAAPAHCGGLAPQGAIELRVPLALGPLALRRPGRRRAADSAGHRPGHGERGDRPGGVPGQHRGARAHVADAPADGRGQGRRLRARDAACARAARAAGATGWGSRPRARRLALREAGDTGRVLAWLYGPDEDLDAAGRSRRRRLRPSPSTRSARDRGRGGLAEHRARVHLKFDTGLSRNGAAAADWPEVCAAAAEAEQAGAVEVVGVWSHLAAADEPGHASVADPAGGLPRPRSAGRAAAGLEPTLAISPTPPAR